MGAEDHRPGEAESKAFPASRKKGIGLSPRDLNVWAKRCKYCKPVYTCIRAKALALLRRIRRDVVENGNPVA